MDRKTQIEFLANGESRVRSYVSKWLENPGVRRALERRPVEEQKNDEPPYPERQRKVG